MHSKTINNLLRLRRSFSSRVFKSSKICVVGSGPSGFYTSKYLLSANESVQVDMIEALPTPYGLIRSGVAPDHQDVKAVQNDFAQVADNDRFSFFGNVTVGNESDADTSVLDLRERYNAVVFCTGASSDRMLGIPGEDLVGVHSARAVVNWYNSHPDFVHYPLDLSASTSGTCIVIGQGNVAVDCSRLLSCAPSKLSNTDIADHALDALENSGIRKVIMLGRRGHVQASFTMKELRDLTKLDGTTFVVSTEELDASMTQATEEEIKNGRVPKRMNKLLRQVADRTVSETDNELQLSFLRSPLEIVPHKDNSQVVGGIRVGINKLEGSEGKQNAIDTGKSEFIPCDLVLRSVGYLGLPIDDVAFDFKRSTISNTTESAGRIVDPESCEIITGMYTSGWAKRGPSGIVGTNIPCAKETVQSIFEDETNGLLPTIQKEGGVAKLLNIENEVIDWMGYLKIEKHEDNVGEKKGKVRDKLLTREEMLIIGNTV
jgi:adrenodoxin-NADP+ reductase